MLHERAGPMVKSIPAAVLTESTHDWVGREWSAPLNAVVKKLRKIGNQPANNRLGTLCRAGTLLGGEGESGDENNGD